MQMRAALIREFKKPLSLETVTVPEVGSRDVLVKLKASGICQSDLHLWRGAAPKLPLIPGHENAGVIERIGEQVRNAKIGDRVVCDNAITCGECYFCDSGRGQFCDSITDVGWNRDGGYAEYIVLPARSVYPLPDQVSFEEGAIIGCAVVTAYHATKKAELQIGRSVIIFGLGGVGYHVLKLSRALGAGLVIAVDIDDRKLARARGLGALTVNPKAESLEERVKELTNGRGVDCAFEAIGNTSTILSALRSATKGGKVILIGVCFGKIEIAPWDDIAAKEVEVTGCNDHPRHEMTEIIELVRQKKIDLTDSITHRIKLEDVNHGIEMVDKKSDDSVRIVMLQ
jgi:alcohol dehydrogenase, propanol-preferring